MDTDKDNGSEIINSYRSSRKEIFDIYFACKKAQVVRAQKQKLYYGASPRRLYKHAHEVTSLFRTTKDLSTHYFKL